MGRDIGGLFVDNVSENIWPILIERYGPRRTRLIGKIEMSWENEGGNDWKSEIYRWKEGSLNSKNKFFLTCCPNYLFFNSEKSYFTIFDYVSIYMI